MVPGKSQPDSANKPFKCVSSNSHALITVKMLEKLFVQKTQSVELLLGSRGEAGGSLKATGALGKGERKKDPVHVQARVRQPPSGH